MILDTHQHYWKVARGDYHWMSPEVKALCRDFLPADLQPELERNGVAATIVVQAAETEAETRFLLDLARQTPSIAGVVGWLELDRGDFVQRLADLRRDPAFLSVRPMIQDLEDDRWILHPRVLDSLRYLQEEQFPIDLLTLPRHLPYLIDALEQVPQLHAVINHLSKPFIQKGETEPWASHMQQLSSYSGIHCKLSGMVTEANHANWTPADLRPYVEHAFHAFGPQRLMYGSDWPVCTLAASYTEVLNALRSLLSDLATPEDTQAIFFDNGKTFYRVSS